MEKSAKKITLTNNPEPVKSNDAGDKKKLTEQEKKEQGEILTAKLLKENIAQTP